MQKIKALVPRWVVPDWPAPKNIRAYVTTRDGDLNVAPYNGFNTADHVGDDLVVVQNNRHLLAQHFQWQRQPHWLNQVHGTAVVDVEASTTGCDADASVTNLLDSPWVIHRLSSSYLFYRSL